MADRLVAGQPRLAAQARRRPDRGGAARVPARAGPSPRTVGIAGAASGVAGHGRTTAQCLLVPPTRSAAPDRTGSPWRSRTCSWTGRSGGHQRGELVEGERLLAVGQRLVGSRVDLDHDPVGADRDPGRAPAA